MRPGIVYAGVFTMDMVKGSRVAYENESERPCWQAALAVARSSLAEVAEGRGDQTVFCHCVHAINRSAITAALLLVSLLGPSVHSSFKDIDSAILFLQGKRKEVNVFEAYKQWAKEALDALQKDSR